MRTELLQLAAELSAKRATFAVALVVRREPASSAQLGDMAIVTDAGAVHGWLGGSCIQPTVVREAMAAMRDGVPRLIAFSPEGGASRRPGVSVRPMTCHSGGSVDIYVEPVLPPARLVLFGASPATRALARLGRVLGYAVDAIDPDADAAAFPEADRVIRELDPAVFGCRPAPEKARIFAVVATLGDRDEEAAWSALAIEPAYLGVVASRSRFARIQETLLARGAPADAVARIRSPAGLSIGAKAPEEIALSILAEIVQVRRASEAHAPTPVPPPAAGRDPVCGMSVDTASARHRAEHDGHTYYFCCGGCRERFLAEPSRYLAAAGS